MHGLFLYSVLLYQAHTSSVTEMHLRLFAVTLLALILPVCVQSIYSQFVAGCCAVYKEN
jgi:hypothetical protein